MKEKDGEDYRDNESLELKYRKDYEDDKIQKVLENDNQNNYFFILIRIIIIIYVDDERGYYINFFEEEASEVS